MVKNIKVKNLILVVIFLSIFCITPSQSVGQVSIDTMEYEGTSISKYSYFLNDTYLTFGINLSGIYYSNNFRQLSYATGFGFGLEHYIPTTYKFFINAGANLSNRAFIHRYSNQGILRYQSIYFDIPITASFELPILREYDFRMILGLFGSTRIASWTNNTYTPDYIRNGNFTYDNNHFNRFDFGWLFGASIEYKNYMLRIRGFSGWNNLQKNEQGMINTFTFDVGYFLFRGKKK
ncbi:MAG TPA: outer membrane beta-barrel protein [Saprospiraceae bacterium]|nr:outer membrane beta-barrel protein [Saprospiraceae bacterium]